MCGLWASIGGTLGAQTKSVISALAAISHRGPDGQNSCIIETPSGPLTLGHSRLAIYDLSDLGVQPMSLGPLTIVFNGAIYNFRQIRQDLEAIGYTFSTETDTEVLLAAWMQWGYEAIPRLDGMFAFVIYDQRTTSLWLARDRFGEKPLHITETAKGLAVASEIVALQEAGYLESAQLNKTVARRFLDYGIVEMGEDTFYSEVSRLPAGGLRAYELGADGPKLLLDKSWAEGEENWSEVNVMALPDARLSLRTALENSVRLRQVADVTVGACLSGGLDSSAIVRLVANQRGETTRPLQCFCAVFDDTDLSGDSISEREYVEQVVAQGGLDLTYVTLVEDEAISLIDTLLIRQGEPFASLSILAQYKVFQTAAAAGVSVMLDGQGADELFGGYEDCFGPWLATLLHTGGVKAWLEAAQGLSKNIKGLSLVGLAKATFNSAFPEKLRRRIAWLRGRWPPKTQVTSSEFEVIAPSLAKGTAIEKHLNTLVAKTSLPSLLRYEDRNAMAFGIESRLPFLSKEVVEVANAIPAHLKIRNGWTKAVLRDALVEILPTGILERRRKLSFVTPQDKWMRKNLGAWAVKTIQLNQRRLSAMVDWTKVTRLLASVGEDPETNSAIFRLACLARWCELHDIVA